MPSSTAWIRQVAIAAFLVFCVGTALVLYILPIVFGSIGVVLAGAFVMAAASPQSAPAPKLALVASTTEGNTMHSDHSGLLLVAIVGGLLLLALVTASAARRYLPARDDTTAFMHDFLTTIWRGFVVAALLAPVAIMTFARIPSNVTDVHNRLLPGVSLDHFQMIKFDIARWAASGHSGLRTLELLIIVTLLVGSAAALLSHWTGFITRSDLFGSLPEADVEASFAHLADLSDELPAQPESVEPELMFPEGPATRPIAFVPAPATSAPDDDSFLATAQRRDWMAGLLEAARSRPTPQLGERGEFDLVHAADGRQ